MINAFFFLFFQKKSTHTHKKKKKKLKIRKNYSLAPQITTRFANSPKLPMTPKMATPLALSVKMDGKHITCTACDILGLKPPKMLKPLKMPLSSKFESKLKSPDISCLLSYPVYLPCRSQSEARERFDITLSERKKKSASPTQNVLCPAINSSGVEDPKSSGHFSTLKISPTPSCVDTSTAVVSCRRCPIVA
jgi:hypothetical protein